MDEIREEYQRYVQMDVSGEGDVVLDILQSQVVLVGRLDGDEVGTRVEGRSTSLIPIDKGF